MNKWSQWVLDASMEPFDGTVFAYCPIEGDIDGEFTVVTGMTSVGGPSLNGKCVAIWHPDGQQAVEEFCSRHADALEQESLRLKQVG